MLVKLGWLALAGAAGTLARYGVSTAVQRWSNPGFPWGTLAVNLIGCFLFGFIWSLAEARLLISGETRFLLLTGFMGAFTTFSTFGFETGSMLRDGEWLLVAGNLLAHNGLGLLCIFLGLAAGHLR